MLEPPKDIPHIDDAIASEPEDIRRDIANAASRNLYLFATGVLGYEDITEACHGPLCTWWDDNPSRFKNVLMPRGHLKTTIGVSRCLQKITQNPEHRILMANETATNAQRFLSTIRTHAESNRRFRALYSHIIPTDPKQWSQEALTFSRKGVYPTPSFDAIGMTGAMTSRHYTHLYIDDPISEEAAKSKLVMDDVITRLSKLFSLMDNPSRDTLDLVGTRWAFYDVYSYFQERFGSKMARFIRAAIEKGEPIWPERFSLETLADIRNDPKNGGEYSFSCLYMNSPRNSDVQDFNVQDVKYWRWGSDEETLVLYGHNGEIERVVDKDKLDVTVTVDVRYGEKLDSDRDAVVVVGTTDEGDAIVLDAWCSRTNPLEVITKLVQVIRTYNPRVVGIQKVGYEMSIKYHLQAELEREGLYARIVPIKPGGPAKSHIRGLQPVAATGHLYILPTQHILRNELSEFPLGQYDDVADALALQLQLWRGLLSPERQLKYRQSEAKLLRRIHNRGRPDVSGLTPSELEDADFDPDFGRYGEIQEVTLPASRSNSFQGAR